MSRLISEAVVEQAGVPEFADYTETDWAMYFIERYGQIDGGHHKAWVLDQVARILKGNGVIITLATWDDGYFEYRINLAEEEPQSYKDWVAMMLGEYDAEEEMYEYDYDVGIAP